ncbi:MAG TPA: hypothetical protein VD788_13070 [Candidatus Polarisedimenticolaceae bacterium]|nr:hypothetical protein [Candidatus Polarisedimenticolaceae bacterium]
MGSNEHLRDRRRFVCSAIACIAGLPWLARCAGGPGGPDPAAVAEQKQRYDPDLDCSDAKALWPAELATRTDNAYSDRSQNDPQYCFNCANFIAPPSGKGCGSCRTVKGPVNPLGGCNIWVWKRA